MGIPANSEGVIWSCRFCQEKQEQEPTKDDLTTSALSMIGPTTSFSSSDHSVSSCSDLSVDVSTCDRNDQEDGAVDSGQDNLGNGLNINLHQLSSDGALNVVDRF
uniref:Uncharacterized protein n=1 Tax=Rhizophora mucronata TaxID=61149 RepID=A0A2P2PLD4_RHIMU